MNLAQLILLALQASIFALVFALGLSVGMKEATWALRHPRELARVVLAMFVIMPLVAAAMAALLDLNPAVKLALVALALSPLPPLLPNKGIKAGGETSHAVGLLVAAALLAVVVTPVGFAILAERFGLDVAVPTGRVVRVVIFSVLLPLVAGITIHQVAPGLASRLAGPIGKVASLFLVLSFVPILLTTAPAMWSLIGGGTVASLAAFIVVGLAVGHYLTGGREEDRTVLALSTATRHPGVAIALSGAVAAATARPEARLAAPAILLYLVLGAVMSAVYLRIRRKSAPRGAP